MNKNEEKQLAEEMLAKGRAMAADRGIIPSLPPEVKEVKIEYSPFAKKQDSYGNCRKIIPTRVSSVMKVQHPETAEQVQKYRDAHAYTDCKLISASKIGRGEDTDDLHFYANATKWDPITFWHIPKDIPISVPNWVIEHINQVCHLKTLVEDPKTPEELHGEAKQFGMSSAGRYAYGPGKQIFRFVELSA